MPQSTVGYERRTNWAFGASSEQEFVRLVLAGQPEPPRYFGRMKQVNRDGPPVLGQVAMPPLRSPDQVDEALETGVVVDTRPTADFAASHVPGTLNLPMGKNFPTYAGSLLPYDRQLFFLLPLPTPASIRDLVVCLASIGFDQIAGVFGPDVFQRWESGGRRLAAITQLTPHQLRAGKPDRIVVDVRNRSEWDAGRIPGARLIPLPELVDRLAEVPEGPEIVVHCQGGGRSAVAASVLESAGRRVANLAGGFGAWVAADGEIER